MNNFKKQTFSLKTKSIFIYLSYTFRTFLALTPYVTTCTPSTCGENALCTLVASRPVCSCPRGYYGDPIYLCKRAECLDTSDCPGHLSCINEKCSDPCQGTCGTSANCETRNHVPVCSCPPGYTGNPFTSCRKFDPGNYGVVFCIRGVVSVMDDFVRNNI